MIVAGGMVALVMATSPDSYARAPQSLCVTALRGTRWFSCPTGVPWSFDTVSGSIPACGVGGLWATWATPKPLPGLAHDRFRSSACRCISLRNEQNTLY